MKNSNSLLILFLITIMFSCDGSEQKDVQAPPVNVSVFVTQNSEVPIYREYIGQTLGYMDIDIAARVEGFLEEIHFEEGSSVNEGELLYTIETQQYEANVAEKKSNLAEQKTILANAKSDLQRYESLIQENAISEIDYDSAKSRYEAAISSVEAAKANLEAAEILLGYTEIHSPLTGIIGKTKAKVGDFVGSGPNNTILNTVSTIDPILVQFYITESEYLNFARKFIEKERGRSEEIKLILILADNTTYNHRGKIDFIDRSVDTKTGSILIQASFPNPDHLLRPGQFGKIKAEIEVIKNGILVPQRCITEIQGIFMVYVVDENNKIQSRQVETGPKIDSFWLINSGLKPGEKVVYEGLQFIKEGAHVNPAIQTIPLPALED